MSKVTKDFANSYSQLCWDHAVAEYERLRLLAQGKSNPLQEYAIEWMKKLESEYPQLTQ